MFTARYGLNLFIKFRIIWSLKGKNVHCGIIAGVAFNQNWTGCLWKGDSPLKVMWLLYVPAGLTFRNSTFCPHRAFMCFVWIWEQTAIISLYSINWPVFITETQSVFTARYGLNLYIKFRIIRALKRKTDHCGIIAGVATNQNWTGCLWKEDSPLQAMWLLYVPPV